MGKHRSRSPSSSDDSESSRERKRHKKERKEKKEKKEKHKKHKKSKHGSREDKERERLLREAKKFLKQQLKRGGDAPAAAAAAAAPKRPPEPPYDGPLEPISADDYFLKNKEYAAWLREERGVFFSEQSTEQNRAMFEDFVAAWNARRLPAALYRGEVGGGAAGAPRTSHAWAIKGGGAALAERAGAVGMAAALDEEMNLKEQARVVFCLLEKHGGMAAALDEMTVKEEARAAALAERREQRREAKEWLDDQVPRLAGKDKALEEKRARRELARSRDDDPEYLPKGLDVLGGGGDDSFAAAKAREAARQERRGRFQAARQAEVQQKVAAARAAEADKMAQFKALLAAGPIQIAKRAPQ